MRYLGYYVAILLLLSSPRSADALTIDHTGAGCVVAGRFPAITARVDPIGDVARARVYFRAGGTPHWYVVEMHPEAGAFSGVLPKPRKELKAIDYYVEVLDRASAPTRTVEHHPDVVPSAGECRKAPAALALTQAKVVVGAVPGAAPLPPGFADEGLVAATGVSTGGAGAAVGAGAVGAGAGAAAAAGGGISTAVIVVGAVGVVGAGAAVVATRGDSGDSGDGQETYQGTFSGQRTVTSTGISGGVVISVCSWTSAISATLSMTLSRRPDGTVTGNAESTLTETEITRSCPSPSGRSVTWRCNVGGTVGQITCRTQTDKGSVFNAFEFSGALSGTTITGTLIYSTGGAQAGGPGESFARSGSTTFPVTLTRR